MSRMNVFMGEADMESESIHIAFGCLDVIEHNPKADKSPDDYSLSMQNDSDYEN